MALKGPVDRQYVKRGTVGVALRLQLPQLLE